MEYDLASSYEALGWNEARWNGEDPTVPDTESKKYNELTAAQKTAASTVCYTQKIWDYEVLPFCLDKTGTVNGKKCHYMSLDISRCFSDKSGAHWKHCPNTCGTCDWDLSPVNPPPVSPPVTCKDDCAFTFKLKSSEDKVGCRWIKKNRKQVDKRKNMYCSDPKILAACPATCNEQCANTPGFRYALFSSEKEGGCGWIIKNKKERFARMKKYCPTAVGEKCISSCGSC